MIDWIVAVATVIALAIAAWELRSNSRISGQTHAREAWIRYLELGFANPEYGSTAIALRHLKLSEAQELLSENPQNEKYWWFLDIMLEACEGLVNYFPEKEWQNTVRYNVLLHKEAIELKWSLEERFYSKKLNRSVRSVLKNSASNALQSSIGQA